LRDVLQPEVGGGVSEKRGRAKEAQFTFEAVAAAVVAAAAASRSFKGGKKHF